MLISSIRTCALCRFGRPHLLLTLLALLGLSAFTGSRVRADVKVSFEQKDGDKVSDVVKLVAKAESSAGIDKVEFRIDDQLKYTDTSTPYEYDWDTLADKEGQHTLTATAFDSDGQTARATIKLTVDNELNVGADTLAKRAQEALANKDVEGAKKFSRRALKADPGNLNAARSLAGIYIAGQDYDKAIATLDKATGLDNDATAMTDLASYRMRRALQPDYAPKFFSEAQTAAELRRKAGDLLVADIAKKNAGTDTPAAHDAIGDAMMRAGRFHDAAAEYSKSGTGDATPIPSINRYGLALVMDNRPLDAITALRNLQLGKRDDAQSRAIIGLAHLRMQHFAEARDAVKQDLPDHVLASLIVASYADTALSGAYNTPAERKLAVTARKLAIDEATDAVALQPNLAETQYAFAIASTKTEESDAALSKALYISPFETGPYLDYATEQVFQKRQDRYDQALNLTDLVLKQEPENVQAKLTQALIYIYQKRYTEAQPLLADLQKKYPDSPDVLTTIGVFYQAKGNNANAGQFFEAVRKADQKRFNYTIPPTALELLLRLRALHYRADFFLTPAALYPATS